MLTYANLSSGKIVESQKKNKIQVATLRQTHTQTYSYLALSPKNTNKCKTQTYMQQRQQQIGPKLLTQMSLKAYLNADAANVALYTHTHSYI